MKVILLLLITSSALTSCKTVSTDRTITYPAYLITENPKAYLGCYVKVIGKLTFKRPQDLFPPYPGDPLVCDSSGCVYVHDDYQDIKKYVGKRVKVLGYVKVNTFNFPYIDVLKVVPLEE